MRKRGRPHKFGRPTRLVAMRLPEDVIDRLRGYNADLAKAVVAIVENSTRRSRKPATGSDDHSTELVQVAPRRFLITVDPRIIRRLPGCDLVPFSPKAAFIALEPGHGLGDLALAVAERLEEPDIGVKERSALLKLRAALRKWRGDRSLTHITRSIVLVRRRTATSSILPWLLLAEPLELFQCILGAAV